MPVMNGIEATKLYRFSMIGQRRVPIVALTADATSEAWPRCEEAGMDGYATKPIEPARLLEIIERVSGRTEVARPPRPAIDVGAAVAARGAPANTENVLDEAALSELERLGGHTFVFGLVSQFSDDAAELLSSMRMAVADEDIQRFRDAAHALRGSAANLGAAKIFEACHALRTTTSSQLAIDGDACVSRLNSDVDDTIVRLKAHMAARRTGAPIDAMANLSRH
jgi:two-component system, sensor histidine kinase RpfC